MEREGEKGGLQKVHTIFLVGLPWGGGEGSPLKMGAERAVVGSHRVPPKSERRWT